ncbi:aconitate hydratase B, partial [Klebsiella pneumoniae]
REEQKDQASLGNTADQVKQSNSHTAANPKPVDDTTHQTEPDNNKNRGGVSLRPGEGETHTRQNRKHLPDTEGTGGDTHTRFPNGITIPAG